MAGDGRENGAKDYIEADGHAELADTPTETASRVCQRGHHYAGNHENGTAEYLHDRQHRNDHQL